MVMCTQLDFIVFFSLFLFSVKITKGLKYQLRRTFLFIYLFYFIVFAFTYMYIHYLPLPSTSR
jgi:hypothetical protein